MNSPSFSTHRLLAVWGISISSILMTIPIYADIKPLESSGQSEKAPQAHNNEKLTHLSPKQKSSPKLPNLIQLSNHLFSGGTPIGNEGFSELQQLGIKTVISVDGAKPQVEYAKKYNIRYVHIPIGYDGIKDQKKSQLLSIFTKCEPPYYYHCHHGKHRGPAALASALCAGGYVTLEQARAFLTLAGTSKNYPGLWKSITDSSKSPQLPAPNPLTSTAVVSDMAGAMASIDVIYDNLKYLAKRDWKASQSSPDITAEHQALLLLEHIKEIPRTVKDEQLNKHLFIKFLKTHLDDATQLENALRQQNYNQANLKFKHLKKSCTDCHSEFRN